MTLPNIRNIISISKWLIECIDMQRMIQELQMDLYRYIIWNNVGDSTSWITSNSYPTVNTSGVPNQASTAGAYVQNFTN